MIPAIIVGGFLGAGKTTLVQRVLDQARRDGLRLAVISNEFGDTGIDRALLDAGEEGFVELDGGCVCCRLSDALGETLERLITATRPDRLVLETSGAALPAEVLVQFWRPPISDLISDELVVIVVDATRLLDDAHPPDDTFFDQIDAADLMLLNKCDLLDVQDLERAEGRLRLLNPDRPILRCSRADVDIDVLFPPEPGTERLVRRDPQAELHDHSHVAYGTRELTFPGVVDADHVQAELEALAPLRAKGFVRTADGVRLIQGVGRRVSVELPPFDVPDHLIGRVVIISAQ